MKASEFKEGTTFTLKGDSNVYTVKSFTSNIGASDFLYLSVTAGGEISSLNIEASKNGFYIYGYMGGLRVASKKIPYSNCIRTHG